MKKIVFRVDASSDIGIGHVMRCATLADALKNQGAKILFLCLDLPGSRVSWLREKGYQVSLLTRIEGGSKASVNRAEAVEAIRVIRREFGASGNVSGQLVDWVVSDHYRIGEEWHKPLRAVAHRILVIDDLGDRDCDCDLLLDQNLDAHIEKYRLRCPCDCEFMLGTQYALLRPEFANWRDQSLERKLNSVGAREIMLSLGGADNSDLLLRIAVVIDGLYQRDLLPGLRLHVNSGSHLPDPERFEAAISRLDIPVELSVNSNEMAKMMFTADLAIGAAGTTSWERAVMGLPTLLIILAENQRLIGKELVGHGAAQFLLEDLSLVESIGGHLTDSLLNLYADRSMYRAMVEQSAQLCDGLGTQRVVAKMMAL